MYLVDNNNAQHHRDPRELSVRLGKMLLDAGKLSEQDIAQIVEYQHQHSLRFGEAALRLGRIKEEDLVWALSRQFDYPCLPEQDGTLAPELIVAHAPFGRQSEAIRELRSQLVLRWFSAEHKLLPVVGVNQRVGSSVLAANLAISLAQLGHHTLLIDSNLRGGCQHRLFGLNPQSGLSGMLNERIALEHAAVSVNVIKRLSVLSAGPTPPNPQELLMRSAFVELLAEASRRYDNVIIDCSPAHACADAQIVAASAGCALLVAERNMTRAVDLAQLREQFALAGVQIVGAILNDEAPIPRKSAWSRLFRRDA